MDEREGMRYAYTILETFEDVPGEVAMVLLNNKDTMLELYTEVDALRASLASALAERDAAREREKRYAEFESKVLEAINKLYASAIFPPSLNILRMAVDQAHKTIVEASDSAKDDARKALEEG